MPRKAGNTIDRFWSKVQRGEGCWEWQGSCTGSNGYGQFWVTHTIVVRAHRFAYELTHGSIPKDAIICHRCDNPRCVRPDHLFSGTFADNTADMFRKGRAAIGERHWTRRAPERMVAMQGANNPTHRFPDRVARGERAARARLTWAKVRVIRLLYARGGLLQRAVATLFGVDQTLISQIVLGKIWREPTHNLTIEEREELGQVMRSLVSGIDTTLHEIGQSVKTVSGAHVPFEALGDNEDIRGYLDYIHESLTSNGLTTRRRRSADDEEWGVMDEAKARRR